MKACVNQCGDVAKHGPYCTDCANESRTEKRGKPKGRDSENTNT